MPKRPGLGSVPTSEDLESLTDRSFSSVVNSTAETLTDHYTNPDQFEVSYSNLGKRATTSQVNAPNEMTFISWPQGIAFRDLNRQYNYDSSAGGGQTVYSLDFGANLNNPVSAMYNPHYSVLIYKLRNLWLFSPLRGGYFQAPTKYLPHKTSRWDSAAQVGVMDPVCLAKLEVAYMVLLRTVRKFWLFLGL